MLVGRCDRVVAIWARRGAERPGASFRRLRDRCASASGFDRRSRQVDSRSPASPSITLENPRTAFLAPHLTVKEPLDHLTMRAQERFHRKLLQQRERPLPRAVRRKGIVTLELEPEQGRQRTNGLTHRAWGLVTIRSIG